MPAAGGQAGAITAELVGFVLAACGALAALWFRIESAIKAARADAMLVAQAASTKGDILLSARAAQVRQIGQAWASGSVGPDPAFVAGGNAKAIDQAKPLLAKAPADATTGAGIGSGRLGGVLEQARQHLDPMAGSSQLIGNIVAARGQAFFRLSAAHGWAPAALVVALP